jgi:hypothetical protein
VNLPQVLTLIILGVLSLRFLHEKKLWSCVQACRDIFHFIIFCNAEDDKPLFILLKAKQQFFVLLCMGIKHGPSSCEANINNMDILKLLPSVRKSLVVWLGSFNMTGVMSLFEEYI